MDLQLKGRRALVTGSTAGIGLAIATALAREGASVIVNGRSDARVKEAIAAVKGFGEVTGISADLGTAAGAKKLIAELPDVDILVNNVGIFEAVPFVDITDEHWTKLFEVNVMSGVRLSRYYLPRMIQKDWGRVIFISSESAINPPAEMVHYGMTKTAQLAVARGLAEMTAGTKVTVNSLLPGPTRSEGVGDFVGGLAKSQNVDVATVEKDFFLKVRPTSLLKRFIETDEIASAVAYLCSPLASAINGSAMRVDGGTVRSVM